jgi:murein DD-endopeptidase MepM/ murein hydrolase activator NlpD
MVEHRVLDTSGDHSDTIVGQYDSQKDLAALNVRSGASMLHSLVRFTVAALVVLVLLPHDSTSGLASGPPFGLPITGEPGPSTWYVSHWFGNTVSAAQNADDLYSRGQGIHFGVDFAAACGTPVVAIGDGVVFAVDGPYGSPPHNLVLQHPEGYFSLYGHLQISPSLRPGQPVSRGDSVGQVGDPAGASCTRAPHLHLEIRTPDMSRAVNPVPLIDADWRLLTIGASTTGSGFAVNFDDPFRWQHIDDQPSIVFGGTRLNDFRDAWLIR